jgi:hypothetical protein
MPSGGEDNSMVVAVLAMPASAGQVHKETERFTDSHVDTIPAGEICEFPVGIQEEVKISETLWFDSEGDLLKAHLMINGTTAWSGPGGSATEHWSWSGRFDPATMTFSQSGNVWNLHQNGLVLHDKGLIVFDDTTGDVLKVAGPHEEFFEGLGALCEAIG